MFASLSPARGRFAKFSGRSTGLARCGQWNGWLADKRRVNKRCGRLVSAWWRRKGALYWELNAVWHFDLRVLDGREWGSKIAKGRIPNCCQAGMEFGSKLYGAVQRFKACVEIDRSMLRVTCWNVVQVLNFNGACVVFLASHPWNRFIKNFKDERFIDKYGLIVWYFHVDLIHT